MSDTLATCSVLVCTKQHTASMSCKEPQAYQEETQGNALRQKQSQTWVLVGHKSKKQGPCMGPSFPDRDMFLPTIVISKSHAPVEDPVGPQDQPVPES